MLGWSFFCSLQFFSFQVHLLYEVGTFKASLGWKTQGACVCLWVEVGGGDGFHFYWFSLLIILYIDYSSAGVSISTSIIKYWSYWVLLASFWLLFLLLPWFGFVSAWWEVSEWWTYHVFRHVAICVFIGLITHHHLGVEALLPDICRIFSRAGESSECARPNPHGNWRVLPTMPPFLELAGVMAPYIYAFNWSSWWTPVVDTW